MWTKRPADTNFSPVPGERSSSPVRSASESRYYAPRSRSDLLGLFQKVCKPLTGC